MNLVLRSAHTQTSLRSLRKLDCGARVSKDGHKRDRASGHPSRRSARILRGSRASTRAPQDDGARQAPSGWGLWFKLIRSIRLVCRLIITRKSYSRSPIAQCVAPFGCRNH